MYRVLRPGLIPEEGIGIKSRQPGSPMPMIDISMLEPPRRLRRLIIIHESAAMITSTAIFPALPDKNRQGRLSDQDHPF